MTKEDRTQFTPHCSYRPEVQRFQFIVDGKEREACCAPRMMHETRGTKIAQAHPIGEPTPGTCCHEEVK